MAASRRRRPPEPLDPTWSREVELPSTGLFPAEFVWHPDKARRPFQLALLGRMIFSCLIDADRIDTERFYAAIEGRAVDREWPPLPPSSSGWLPGSTVIWLG